MCGRDGARRRRRTTAGVVWTTSCCSRPHAAGKVVVSAARRVPGIHSVGLVGNSLTVRQSCRSLTLCAADIAFHRQHRLAVRRSLCRAPTSSACTVELSAVPTSLASRLHPKVAPQTSRVHPPWNGPPPLSLLGLSPISVRSGAGASRSAPLGAVSLNQSTVQCRRLPVRLSDGERQSLSDTVRHCQPLSGTVSHCQALSDPVSRCQRQSQTPQVSMPRAIVVAAAALAADLLSLFIDFLRPRYGLLRSNAFLQRQRIPRPTRLTSGERCAKLGTQATCNFGASISQRGVGPAQRGCTISG